MLKTLWQSQMAWMLGLIGLLSLHFWFPRMSSGLQDDTYSVELAGKKALYLFAEQEFDYIGRNHDSLSDRWNLPPDPGDALCLLGPHRPPTPAEWKPILNWVGEGGILIVAAQWDDPEITIPSTKVSVEELSGKDIDVDLEGEGVDDWATGTLRDVIGNQDEFRWRSKGQIAGDGIRPLLTVNEKMQAGIVSVGNGSVVLIASDYVFSNQSLAWKDDVVMARGLLTAAGVPEMVIFDESLNESGTPKVVGLLLDPYFRPLSIHLGVCLLLFGWWGNRRFGPLLDSEEPPRRDITDHTNALGNLYYKTNAAQPVLRAYLEQLRLELRLRSGAHAERILAPVARRANRSVEDVLKLFQAADKAAKSRNLDRRDAAQLIRHLAEIRAAARS